MRALIIGALAAAGIMLAADSHAQTSAQWSQLIGYVGQQSKLIIDLRARVETLEAENTRQRNTINQTIAALDQERCRTSRLSTAVRDATLTEPTRPITLVDNVACIDLKSPPPPFPSPLAAPAP
jgi:hypothetical protein